MPTRLSALLSFACLLWISPALAEDVAITPRARELFQMGVAFLEDPDGPRYEDAYRAFKAAYKEAPSPRILGNIGLCAMKLERDGEAIAAYRRYLTEVDDVDPEERAQIRRDLRLLEHGSATMKLRVEPAGAFVVDERKPARGAPVTNRYGPLGGDVELRVRAGMHRLRIEHPDGGAREITMDLEPGETHEERLVLEPEEKTVPPTPEPPREAKLPIAFVQRPMTLPERTLAPALGVRYGRRLGGDSGQPVAGIDLLGASYGILDDLQIDLAPLPLEILPKVDYGTPNARLSFRFLDEVVELGNYLELGLLRRPDDRIFYLDLGMLAALAHLGEWGRLDAAFELDLLFPFGERVIAGMHVPLKLAFQPVELFHLGIESGVGIFDFNKPRETVFIPVGAFAGVTIPLEEQPLLDVGLRFGFDRLFLPGSDDRVVETRSYLGLFSLRLFFFL